MFDLISPLGLYVCPCHPVGFPRILEKPGKQHIHFQVMEMSLNFTKSGNVLEKILLVKNPIRTKKTPVNKHYGCRRKLQL